MAELLKLNVGGHRYTTTKATLRKYPDSMLGAMFNGKMPSTVDDHGHYFIDRDGQMFGFILNFLRSSQLTLPPDFNNYSSLMVEADFYQIKPLIETLHELQQQATKQAPRHGRYLEVIEVRVGSTATMPTKNSRIKTVISGRVDAINALPSNLIGDSDSLRETLQERMQSIKDTDLYTELELFGSHARIRIAEYLYGEGWELIDNNMSSSSAFDSRMGTLTLEHSYRDKWFLPQS